MILKCDVRFLLEHLWFYKVNLENKKKIFVFFPVIPKGSIEVIDRLDCDCFIGDCIIKKGET